MTRRIITVAVLFLAAASLVRAQEAKLKISCKETSFGQLPPGARTDYMRFSADGLHAAYPVHEQDQWYVMLDGKPSAHYDWILPGSLALSREGGHCAFIVQLKDGMQMIVDGKPQKAYNELTAPTFSPDGTRIAYTAKLTRDSKGVVLVVDGNESKEYERIAHWSLVFSRDGKHFAYSAENGNSRFWVIDGKEGKPSEQLSPLELSPDGQHYAYSARHGEKFVPVIDGVEGPAYDKVGGFAFSPDSKRLAYVVLKGKRMIPIIDGKEGDDYRVVSETAFSSDSKHYAYVALEGSVGFVVLDGKPMKPHDKVLALRFSGDGRHVMYTAIDGISVSVCVDDQPGKAYSSIGTMVINDDGSRWAYSAKQVEKEYAVINGNELFGAGNLTMSPGDGRYVAHAGDRLNTSVLYINGTEGPTYDGFLKNSFWVFDGPGKLYVMAGKAGALVRVEVSISPQ